MLFSNFFYRVVATVFLINGAWQALIDVIDRTPNDRSFWFMGFGMLFHLLIDIKNIHEKRN